MNINTLLVILVLFLLLGALPTWPYSTNWGYFPSGGLGIIVIVLVILMIGRKGRV